jgi:putative salt-induced outer membrane protein YdiY
LRFVPAGGAGYHAIKTERTILDLQFGASMDREFYSTGLNRTFAEVLVGEEFSYKLGANSTLKEKLVLFPNMTDTGNYRINLDTTMLTAIRKWFNWQFTVSDRYLSNPIAGRKSNDLLLTTGVRLVFK